MTKKEEEVKFIDLMCLSCIVIFVVLFSDILHLLHIRGVDHIPQERVWSNQERNWQVMQAVGS